MNKIDIAVELAKRVYFEHPVGGVLHVCLDDGNLYPDLFRWCMYEAEHGRDITFAECECGEFWRNLTEAEMSEAYARRADYNEVGYDDCLPSFTAD